MEGNEEMKSEKGIAEAINEVAGAIKYVGEMIEKHSKSIDRLQQVITWSFRTEWDANVADMLGQIGHQLKQFNEFNESK